MRESCFPEYRNLLICQPNKTVRHRSGRSQDRSIPDSRPVRASRTHPDANQEAWSASVRPKSFRPLPNRRKAKSKIFDLPDQTEPGENWTVNNAQQTLTNKQATQYLKQKLIVICYCSDWQFEKRGGQFFNTENEKMEKANKYFRFVLLTKLGYGDTYNLS